MSATADRRARNSASVLERVEVVVAPTERVQQRTVEHATTPQNSEQIVDVSENVDAAIRRHEKWMREYQGNVDVLSPSVRSGPTFYSGLQSQPCWGICVVPLRRIMGMSGCHNSAYVENGEEKGASSKVPRNTDEME